MCGVGGTRYPGLAIQWGLSGLPVAGVGLQVGEMPPSVRRARGLSRWEPTWGHVCPLTWGRQGELRQTLCVQWGVAQG